ncbi:CrcB family protein [Cyanobium sp. WAJ14-Wanaka]|uniref:FluC/FEX family fluoride channel n=1 Tax=Cyanobium sp. WAJ14-Wanaka TaxID=2823725 RepID=UPI0020CCC042|nr:CrcB family protein [Cyanobium sp. WAJ14-Wanaka]MCP9774205.1 CrcB family protein [Cyanobium sp. WAJ14-Wanaka]
MSRQLLAAELKELTLVSCGAIPGALLRWQLVLILGSSAGTLAANLFGCAVIGALIALPTTRQRLFLAAGVGFCGSLTTFSSWILGVTKAMAHRHWATAAGELSLNLALGLLVLALAYGLVRIRR